MWYFQKNNAKEGPREEREILDLIRNGELTRTTLVWTTGMSDWAAAEDTALSSLFLSIPPPVRSTPSGTPIPPLDMVAAAPTEPGSSAPLSNSAPLGSSAPAGFRDPRPLSKFVTALLVMTLFWSLVAIWSGLLQLELLNRVSLGQTIAPEVANANDTREHVFALVRVGLFIFTVVVFARWIYVVARNIRSLGADRLQFTPGWAVGYYFIPIVNLWRPYQAMKEIWKASHEPVHWQLQKGSFLLVSWWTFWIISCLIGQMAVRTATSAKTASDYIDATTFSIASDVIEIPLCLIALVLVLRLSRVQCVTATKTS
jgi:hypothetical protein